MTTAPPRPTLLSPKFDTIPEHLRDGPFVVWKLELRPDDKGELKWTKPPYTTDGDPASSTDPKTWTNFTSARAAYEAGDFDGIGQPLAPEEDAQSILIGVDWDKCIDPATGEIDPLVLLDVRHLNTYTERSPSGVGLRAFVYVRGGLPVKSDGTTGRNWRNIKTEAYQSGRYLTITGHHVEGTPSEPQERTEALRRLYATWEHRNEQAKHAARIDKRNEAATADGRADDITLRGQTDDELLRAMLAAKNGDRYRKLLFGNWEGLGFESQNEADASLIEGYVFYGYKDLESVDRLFRRSLLYREKWERKDYRERTLKFVLSRQQDKNERNGHAPAGDGPPNGANDQGTREAPAAPSGKFKLTDLGNAERLVHHFGQGLRYVPSWGWMTWDGRRWRRDPEGIHVTRLAQRTVRLIYDEAAAEDDADRRATLAKHAAGSERSARIAGMVALARSLPQVRAEISDFDTNPYLITCLGGTVDLRTGQLRPHCATDYITKLAKVEYQSDAVAPTWTAFLKHVMAGNDEMVGFIQRAAGYSLSGSTKERAIFIPWGSGKNGKSTLLDTLAAILGDYAQQAPANTLMAKRDDTIPNDVARLAGARLVTAIETAEGKRLDEALVKHVTGDRRIAARFLHQEWFEFRPTFKVWLATNHKPVVRGSDNAIWDRIKLIPFTVRIPDEDIDHDLGDKLLDEAPGILNWLIKGCLDWQREGLGVPEAVKEATDEYRTEMDAIGTFITDCCIVGKDKIAIAAALFRAYIEWCEQNNERKPSQREFGMRLTERGFSRGRRGKPQVWCWHGIGLLDPDDPEDPVDPNEPVDPSRSSGRENAHKEENGGKTGNEDLHGSTARDGSTGQGDELRQCARCSQRRPGQWVKYCDDCRAQPAGGAS
jgi:putative DNA primase/helicase